MTMTTLHLGQAPGRVRRASACPRPVHSLGVWRSAAAASAFGDLRTATVAFMAMGTGYTGNAIPVGHVDCTFTNPTTKRPARHLGSRST